MFPTLLRSTPRLVARRFFTAATPLARFNRNQVRSNPESPDPERFQKPDVIEALKKGELSIEEFDQLSVFDSRLKQTVKNLRYDAFTPVQQQALLPMLVEDGVVCRAKTGTGKTMAFAIPIVQACIDYHNQTGEPSRTHALVVAPTRDLANQIKDEFEKLIDHRSLRNTVTIQLSVGGKADTFVRSVPLIIIATPGRLEARLRDSRVQRSLSDLKYKVYDEADRLLDQGFEETLHNIDDLLMRAKLEYGYDKSIPTRNVLFSATIDGRMDSFARETISPSYRFINCVSEADEEAHENIHQTVVHTQNIYELHVAAISDIIRGHEANPDYKAILFVPTVCGLDFLFDILRDISPPTLRRTIYKLNGGMTQSARERTTERFKTCQGGLLVCTDVAARGLDFKNVTDVVQIAGSSQSADYVHKVGRTARAGASGNATIYLSDLEVRYAQVLKREHGITFDAERVYSTFVEDNAKFEELRLNSDEIEDYIRSIMGFYRSITRTYRLSWERVLKDVVTMMRCMLHDPEAVFRMGDKLFQQNAIPFSLVPSYIDTFLGNHRAALGNRKYGNRAQRQHSGYSRRSSGGWDDHPRGSDDYNLGNKRNRFLSSRSSYRRDKNDYNDRDDRYDRNNRNDRNDRKYLFEDED